MKYEKYIKDNKSLIGGHEDDIRRMEQVLDGRGESSILRHH